MRLEDWEIEGITKGFETVFEKHSLPISNTTLYLFGSRTNDTLKGGDIDLLLRVPKQHLKRVQELKFDFSSAIQRRIGEQKIDILVIDQSPPSEPFAQIAVKEATMIKEW